MTVLRIGQVKVSSVEELRIPNTIAYFTSEEALIESNRHWLAPHFLDAQNCFDLVFQSFVMEVDGKVVLIDPCTGNGKPHPVPQFDRLDVPWLERLDAAGYRREDVDIVMCTHLHHDHCGWNTMLRDGRWVPTFPNARYLMSRTEIERWDPRRPGHHPVSYNVDVFARSVLPVIEAGLVHVHDGSLRVGDCLEVLPAPGHTLGHCWLQVTAGEASALFSGDTFHHPLQLVDPTMQFGGGDDLRLAIASRRQLIELAALRDALIVAAHLPWPHGIKVRLERGQPVFTTGTRA
ncbi:MBL fold metallo-hydrolase [Novosphingobium malaysiense]|uniref:MBL fold metallo-hydrolase n=1 Tax=Novosphingobium malaysiense TaxID=1348853 RepID=UPI00068D4729|nr:MBL fold metallo-hydrolase [Novosphingobium malaysiense]